MYTEAECINLYCDVNKDEAPAHVGTRVTTARTFGPDAGNTTVRHVAKDSRTMAILIDIQDALKTSGYGDYFAFLPPDSFHMTVFDGILDARRAKNYWPEGVSYSAPLSQTRDLFLERLQGFKSPGPFDMKITKVTPNGLHLEGATPADEAIARQWRDALSAVFGHRKPSHDTYGFHVTMAYFAEWLPVEAAPAYVTLLNHLTEMAQSQLPTLELNPPAFCTFENMEHFEELMVL
jgi:hypothetical protein